MPRPGQTGRAERGRTGGSAVGRWRARVARRLTVLGDDEGALEEQADSEQDDDLFVHSWIWFILLKDILCFISL